MEAMLEEFNQEPLINRFVGGHGPSNLLDIMGSEQVKRGGQDSIFGEGEVDRVEWG